jgi:hypothetical protein
MTNGLLKDGENIFAFPQILRSHSSYITLHLIRSDFLRYEENFVFFFISEELEVLSSPLSVIFRQNVSENYKIFFMVERRGASISENANYFSESFRQNDL